MVVDAVAEAVSAAVAEVVVAAAEVVEVMAGLARPGLLRARPGLRAPPARALAGPAEGEHRVPVGVRGLRWVIAHQAADPVVVGPVVVDRRSAAALAQAVVQVSGRAICNGLAEDVPRSSLGNVLVVPMPETAHKPGADGPVAHDPVAHSDPRSCHQRVLVEAEAGAAG